MAQEVTFVTRGKGATPITVNAINVSWNSALAAHRFSPASFAIMEDLLGGKTPNMVVNFGKVAEDVTFEVQFDTDADWKAFRTWWLKTSYKDYTLNGTQRVYKKCEIEFYWGGSGDSFYSGKDDIYSGNDGKYVGLINSVNVSRDFGGKYWRGTIRIWVIGAVI